MDHICGSNTIAIATSLGTDACTLIDIIAEGERVAARYRLTANCDGHPIDLAGVFMAAGRPGCTTRGGRA